MHSKKDFNKNAADKRLENTMGDAANGNNKVTAANSRDSMMASLLIDCFFGAGLNEFLGDALHVPDCMDDLDIVNTVDLVDEFWTDRQNGLAGRKKNRAFGGYELGQRGSLRGGFNTRSDRNAAAEWDMAFDSMTKAPEQDEAIGFFSPAAFTSGATGGFSAHATAPAPL